jgi:polyhydroxyalkanoate synthesis regulator phasin
MSDDLVNQLWESDEASALTNHAARRIEELERGFWNLHREYDKRGDRIEELSNCVAVLEAQLAAIEEEGTESLNALPDCLMKLAPALVENDQLKADLRKMALDYLAAEGQAAEAYQAQLTAEAKLSKSEALLKKVVKMAYEPCPFGYGTEGYYDWWYNRHKLLAELKGETDA